MLLLGTGLLASTREDVQSVATWLVAHGHLNPASRFPHIFIEAAADTSRTDLLVLAAGAGLYAACRLVEGYGLWRARPWAEWLAAGSAAIYLPFELLALLRHANWAHAALLLLNLGLVVWMLWRLYQHRRLSARA